MWEQASTEISHYHSANCVFVINGYRNDCKGKGKTHNFSGVGDQHQNTRAERAIQTIMYMYRIFMIHLALHWTEHGIDDLSLWYFSVKHSVWVYNRVPNQRSGITVIKMLTKTKSNNRYLRHAHVWGCPVFVLEAKLQYDQNLPKWNRRLRLGKFLGFSDEHSTLVANICNLRTGYISHQYHLVFDDLFETTVLTEDNDPVIDNICNDLFDSIRDWYSE